ncbi:MAG: CvpA family protein [Clostridia bacterium]|nr:CvpA family protein [Clostridia bacterium]
MMNNLCAFTIANWLDIAFVVILLLFSVVGAKKGFVAAFFGFISTIIALVAAFLLGDKVMEWTNGLFGLEKIIGN